MSILPELIIQHCLVRGLRTFREKPHLLDMLFRNLTQEELTPIRGFFRDNSIDIAYNYPRDGLGLPSIVILLKTETESQAFLGQVQQSVEDLRRLGGTPFLEDEISGDQTTLGSGSLGQVNNRSRMLLQPTTATGGETNMIWAPLATTRLIDPFEEVALLVLMEGTGAGQRRLVVSIVPSQTQNRVEIEVDQNWDVIPDDTTVFRIESIPQGESLTGEPSQLYPIGSNIERLGEFYKAMYQLDVNGSNQEEAIYLYNVVKAIMIVSRRFLIRQGFLRGVTMSGSDLAPVQEYFPTEAFRRSLTLDFEYPFDVFTEISEAVASELIINISARDLKTSNPEEVVISTSFNVS